jgi:hypothetical protein
VKRSLRLTATTIVLILVSISPAEALFGSECKKPKATYAQYLSSSKSLQIQEANTQARAREQKEQEYRRCLKNRKAFFLEKKISDKTLSCELWKLLYDVPIAPRAKTAFEEYKNAMLIVTSYKKCFDPSVYIEAVKWLKANPR